MLLFGSNNNSITTITIKIIYSRFKKDEDIKLLLSINSCIGLQLICIGLIPKLQSFRNYWFIILKISKSLILYHCPILLHFPNPLRVIKHFVTVYFYNWRKYLKENGLIFKVNLPVIKDIFTKEKKQAIHIEFDIRMRESYSQNVAFYLSNTS